MDAHTRANIHYWLDKLLWYSCMFMSLILVINFAWMYFLDLKADFFEINSYFYYLCLVVYAVERKVKHQLFPNTAHRFGEFFVIGWIGVTAVFCGLTLFKYQDNLKDFTSLVIMVAMVAGIFGFGQGLKLIKLPLQQVIREEIEKATDEEPVE
jgi:hypothetical protein